MDFNKRISDSKEQHDIETLIEQENDPKTRLQLMVMNRINLSLIATTETINAVAAKLDAHLAHFEAHTKAEDEVINKSKGAWIIIAKVIAGVQVIGLGIWAYASNEISSIHEALSQSEKADIALDKRISAIEVKLDALPKKTN